MRWSWPRWSTAVAYATGVATLIVAAQAHVSELPFGLPPQALTVLATLGLAARVVLHFTRSPVEAKAIGMDLRAMAEESRRRRGDGW